MSLSKTVQYHIEQSLTEEEKLQARTNIGAAKDGAGASEKNAVTINPAVDEQVGISYKTFSAALTYVNAQIPTSENKWIIRLPTGLFNEAIYVIDYVYIEGNNTVLTSSVITFSSTARDNSYIKGCTFKYGSSLLFASSANPVYAVMIDCTITNMGAQVTLADKQYLYFYDGKIESTTILIGYSSDVSRLQIINSYFQYGSLSYCSLYDCVIDSFTLNYSEIHNSWIKHGSFTGCHITYSSMYEGGVQVKDSSPTLIENCALSGTEIWFYIVSSYENVIFKNCSYTGVDFVYTSTLDIQSTKLYSEYNCAGTINTSSVNIEYPFIPDLNKYSVGAIYNNVSSGLTSKDVQSAIDELAARPMVGDAEDVSYDNTTSGISATNVQSAIDSLAAGQYTSANYFIGSYATETLLTTTMQELPVTKSKGTLNYVTGTGLTTTEDLYHFTYTIKLISNDYTNAKTIASVIIGVFNGEAAIYNNVTYLFDLTHQSDIISVSFDYPTKVSAILKASSSGNVNAVILDCSVHEQSGGVNQYIAGTGILINNKIISVDTTAIQAKLSVNETGSLIIP